MINNIRGFSLQNRSPPPSYVPSALFYAPPEPLELLCVFPERASRVCAASCNAAARVGGESRAVRGPREALDAFRRDADTRLPHVVVIDARQPQIMDPTLLARNENKCQNMTHGIINVSHKSYSVLNTLISNHDKM
ncbi:unnamed protein product [Euphydryas editha]|uniref:PDE8-like REC N-terminal domain-containing protein n=1 Tax=Euphydryas editha TaxID=104508 RepID=A0AAU9TUZ8_EUPED|nr:unnamed protein product [Euphydryas editha]